jgi:phage antirepressor YoqD-like protein
VKEVETKQPDIFVEVNAYLEARTLLNDEVPTIQEIAKELEIGGRELREWLGGSEIFKEGMHKLAKRLDENLETDDPWANRADVMLVRLILLETKNKFAKP